MNPKLESERPDCAKAESPLTGATHGKREGTVNDVDSYFNVSEYDKPDSLVKGMPMLAYEL